MMAGSRTPLHSRLRTLFLANGVGASLAMGELILLLALMLGASDGQMGLLYAAPYLGALLAVAAPLALNGRDTTNIWAACWFGRSIVMLGYFGLLIVDHQPTQVWLVICVFLAFSLFRSIGLIGNTPTIKALVPPRDLPGTIAACFSWTFTAALIASLLIAATFALPWTPASLTPYLALLGVGMLVNLATSWMIHRLPPTGRLSDGTLRGIGASLRLVFTRGTMRTIAVLTLLQALVGVLIRYPLNYLTREQHWSESAVFWLVVCGYVIAILTNQLLRAIGRRIDPRALLIGTHGLIAVTALGWALIGVLPSFAVDPVAIGLFLLTGVGAWGSITVISRLQTDHLPQRHAPQVTAAFNAIAVVGAIAAMLIATSLEAMTPAVTSLGLGHSYVLLFFILAAIAGTISIRALFGRNLDNPQAPSDLAMLSPTNLLNLYRSWRLEHRLGPAAPTSHGMDALLRGQSRVSQTMLAEYLSTHDLTRRFVAHAMLERQPNQRILESLREDAFDDGSATRYEALSNLATAGTKQDLPQLENLLEDDDPWVRCLAVKAVLQIGGTLEPERIIDTYLNTTAIRSRLEILSGLEAIGNQRLLDQLVGIELEDALAQTWTATVLIHAAGARGLRRLMTDLLDCERGTPGNSLHRLSEIIGSNDLEALQPAMLESRILSGDFAGLMESLAKHLPRPWLKAVDKQAALGVTMLWWHDYRTTYLESETAEDIHELRSTRVTERPTTVGDDVDVEAELAALEAEGQAMQNLTKPTPTNDQPEQNN